MIAKLTILICLIVPSVTSAAGNQQQDPVIKQKYLDKLQGKTVGKIKKAPQQKSLSFDDYNTIREQFKDVTDEELIEHFNEEQEFYFSAIDEYLVKVKKLVKGNKEQEGKLARIKDIEHRMKKDGTSKAEAEEYSALLHALVSDDSLKEIQEDYDHEATVVHYNAWRAARYEMVYRNIPIAKQYEEQ